MPEYSGQDRLVVCRQRAAHRVIDLTLLPLAPRGVEAPAGNAIVGTLLVVFLFNIMFTPDFGVFSTIFTGTFVSLLSFCPIVWGFYKSKENGLKLLLAPKPGLAKNKTAKLKK